MYIFVVFANPLWFWGNMGGEYVLFIMIYDKWIVISTFRLKYVCVQIYYIHDLNRLQKIIISAVYTVM